MDPKKIEKYCCKPARKNCLPTKPKNNPNAAYINILPV